MDALSNNPPLADQLAIDHEALRAEIAAALDGLAAPSIASDEDVVAAREIVRPLRTLQATVETTRVAAKAPYLAAERDVDGFFATLRAGLDTLVAAITVKATAYQTQKREDAKKLEAARARIASAVGETAPAPLAPKETTRIATEAGVVASGSVSWDYEVTDKAALALDLLMENKAAIKAKIAGLKAQGGKIEDAKIPGLRLFEKIGTTWR